MTQLSLEEAMGNKRRPIASSSGSKKQKAEIDKDAEEMTIGYAQNGVNMRRVHVLRAGDDSKRGPVVYWMSRDQRSRDNWALLHAVEQARKKDTSVAVVFNLVDNFLEAKARHFGFMLRGLRVVEKNLKSFGIPFFLLRGIPEETIPAFLETSDSSLLVVDFSPLRIGRTWRNGVTNRTSADLSVHEVDAHNIVPVWIASTKLEYSARTIRTKIQKLLPEFLVEYPKLQSSTRAWSTAMPQEINWDSVIDDVIRMGPEVPEVDWLQPGEDAALEHFLGEKGFVSLRIKNYHDDRNNPAKAGCLSDLSPYLHYGHISAQRCAFEARKVRRTHTKAADAFLEELIIRRELSDNFCHYQPNYDNIEGAWEWARNTLRDHGADPRDHLYTEKELEEGKTYDELWNASQLEMVHRGKMHGFMRMYWAKKILEWTRSPEEALSIAIYLNDKYQLDGRDPNGYVGCMWSICGIHDQGWKERPVFGKIRYMNYGGCKRKFNVDGYIMYVNKLVADLKRKQAGLATTMINLNS